MISEARSLISGFLISGRRHCNVAITILTKIIAGGLGSPPPRGAFWVRPGVSRCKSEQRIPDIGTPTLQRRYHHTYQDHSRRARIAASAWRLLGETCGFLISGRRQCNVAITTLTKIIAGGLGLPPPRGAFWVRPGVSRCKSGQRIPDIGTPTMQRRYHHPYQDHSRRARIAASAWRLLGETCGFLISGRRQCNVAITTLTKIIAGGLGLPPPRGAFWVRPGRRHCNVAITILTKIIAGGLGSPPPRGALRVRPGLS
ncbi:unnamed protein product [Caenorhabditis auriculariae]|uniref:Uncharacterized protein n=1 Tax=Caenorhabditis auriculariae TaxID=2777116 RepID=A0A8S1H706_9PELO|nr:unnamed protein product [Caenorhabditis auriculariae]